MRPPLPSTAYLAGPMRGYLEFNFPAFRNAAQTLRKRGLHVVSPHERDEDEGFDWTGTEGSDDDLKRAGFDIARTLASDIDLIAAPLCEGVVCLPGWDRSRGAQAEVVFARAIDKPVLFYEEASRSNGYRHSLYGTSGVEEWEDGERRG